MPLVSVLLPVRNAALVVPRAIESIQAQTWTDWELVVVDDGSTDGTGERLRALAQADARLRIFSRPAGGIVEALNAGLAEASGEFVARMDADDESHPDRLGEQVAFLRAAENRAIGLASCLVAFGGDRTTSAGYALHVDWINSLVTPEAIALNRFVEAPLAHPSVMFRREVIARHGGYRAGDFPEDYELWLRWMDAGVRMAKVPRVLLTWHDSAGRLSRTDMRYEPKAFFRMKAEWIARWLAAERVSVSRLEGGDRETLTRSATPIFVWGAGRPTRKRAEELEQFGARIAGYIDVDVKKATRAIGGTGRPVITPAELPPAGAIFVLGYVTSRGARELIRAELRARDYAEGRDFLMCA